LLLIQLLEGLCPFGYATIGVVMMEGFHPGIDLGTENMHTKVPEVERLLTRLRDDYQQLLKELHQQHQWKQNIVQLTEKKDSDLLSKVTEKLQCSQRVVGLIVQSLNHTFDDLNQAVMRRTAIQTAM
jgi:hypothetical protein